MKRIVTILISLFIFGMAGAQPVISRLIGNERLGKKDSVANWTIHAQLTVIGQYHPSFRAAYSGVNSMSSSAESAVSLTTTIFLGRKLWKGAALYINPEMSGGQGLSGTKGMAGFANGEIYRVGNPTPTPFIARAYLQQVIALGKDYEVQESDINQLAGKSPTSKFIITLGKFGISDFFDQNTYSHDARSQFLNWALMANGSWDFPADTRGYTYGLVLQLVKPQWVIRTATVLEPVVANGLKMDVNYNKANSETLEGEKDWKVKNHSGAIRATGFLSFTKAPKYTDATAALLRGDSTLEKVIAGAIEGTAYGGVKYGFGVNAEQELTSYLGVFVRANWSDGHTATWAFTEIDNSASAGMSIKGTLWKRAPDIWGLALVTNGISKEHQEYLEAGGHGFIIGDGSLNYGRESIIETYYKAQLASFAAVTLDYQFALHPAYNKDRGPIHIIGIRVHFDI
jgi:high affinity Mn2+ porin